MADSGKAAIAALRPPAYNGGGRRLHNAWKKSFLFYIPLAAFRQTASAAKTTQTAMPAVSAAPAKTAQAAETTLTVYTRGCPNTIRCGIASVIEPQINKDAAGFPAVSLCASIFPAQCIGYVGWVILDPCELNVLITAVTNYLYTTLTQEDFVCLSIFLNELSKSMISTSLFKDLCNREGRFKF